MYPLNVIVIGCDDHLFPHVQRELTNASAQIEGEYAKIGQAVNALRSSHDKKRLLLIHIKASEPIESLTQLSHTFFGWPIIALLDARGPGTPLDSLILTALRAGASQIVPLPIHSDDFKAALDQIVRQFVRPHQRTEIIAVAGATGGCGTTTIAVNLAYEIAELWDLRCILVDLSLKMGGVAPYLNIEPKYTILDLLRDVRRLDTLLLEQVLVPVTENLSLLAGPHHAITPMVPSVEDVMQVVNTALPVAQVVVLDVPCTYDDLFFSTLAAASHVVLVSEQKIPSVRALKVVNEALGREGVRLVLNRYDRRVRGFGADRLAKVLGVSTLHTIAQDSRAVLRALNRGCSLRLEAPRSPALADVGALAQALLGIPPAGSPTIWTAGFLGRLRYAISKI